MKPWTRIKFIVYDNFHVLSLLLVIFAAICMLFLTKVENGLQASLAIVGGLGYSIYLVQKQRLDEMNSFRILFKEFNERYNALNETINEITRLGPDKIVTEKQLCIIGDYFDLCGEEYLYCLKGYIYPEVWEAWCNGMLHYFSNPVIKKRWLDEEKKLSYYGLTLMEIEKSATIKSNAVKWK